MICEQDSQDRPQNDPGCDDHQGGHDDRQVQQPLALYDDPGGKFDVDKTTEDYGGVEDESEGPEGDPEGDVVLAVLLDDLGDQLHEGDAPDLKEVVDQGDSGDNIAEIVEQEHDGEKMNLFSVDEPQKNKKRKKYSKVEDNFQAG